SRRGASRRSASLASILFRGGRQAGRTNVASLRTNRNVRRQPTSGILDRVLDRFAGAGQVFVGGRRAFFQGLFSSTCRRLSRVAHLTRGFAHVATDWLGASRAFGFGFDIVAGFLERVMRGAG